MNAVAAEIEVSVSPANASYENGKAIDYQVTLKNTTAKRIAGISIEDYVADTEANSESGLEKAFSTVTITPSNSWGSTPGSSLNSDGNLVVNDAVLFPYGEITYQFSATVNDTIIGPIELGKAKVTVDLDGDGSAESFAPTTSSVFNPVPYEYSLALSVDKANYTVGQPLTYTLKVTNTGSYQVQGLDIVQAFESLTVDEVNGGKVGPFSNVAISGKKSGSGSNLGQFAKTGDLSVENAKVAVGGKLTYTIVADVVDSIVGNIETSATAHTKDGDVVSETKVTPPAEPNVSITHEINKTNPYLVSSER